MRSSVAVEKLIAVQFGAVSEWGRFGRFIHSEIVIMD
jgi:hypothetical protein